VPERVLRCRIGARNVSGLPSEAEQGRAQILDGRNEHAGLAWVHVLAGVAAVEREDRNAEGARFLERHAEGLHLRRRDEQRALAVNRGHLVREDCAAERHALCDPSAASHYALASCCEPCANTPTSYSPSKPRSSAPPAGALYIPTTNQANLARMYFDRNRNARISVYSPYSIAIARNRVVLVRMKNVWYAHTSAMAP
jgi:hypothetical protein